MPSIEDELITKYPLIRGVEVEELASYVRAKLDALGEDMKKHPLGQTTGGNKLYDDLTINAAVSRAKEEA